MARGSVHRGQSRRIGAGIAVLLALAAAGLPATGVAQQSRPGVVQLSDKPNYPGSPYHGAIDGDGRVIPCRCRFRDQDYRLGEIVCMSTHVGTVLTRCDLTDNNTSWVPSDTPCVVSRKSDRRHDLAGLGSAE